MWKEPWYFAKAEDTERILKEIGLVIWKYS